MNNQYEVLSPWAVHEPVPLQGIQPRVSNLEGKTIGFIPNEKKAAVPILAEVEKQLKAKFPTLKSAGIYKSPSKSGITDIPADWLKLKGVDTVVLAIGD
jgi:hypothetical protein